MKKNKIIDAIGLADERFIAEAAPSKKRSRTVEVSNPFRGERDQREHTALRCLKTPSPTVERRFITVGEGLAPPANSPTRLRREPPQ